MKLELDAPNLSSIEKNYINKAIDSGFVSTFGPYVPEFENEFAQYVGINKAVSTQSGTAAIHIALYELGIGRGDEVIVPALTFVASVNPVLYVGAKPVFADVDPCTWNISPKEIKKLITKKTKAIIAVHLYGNPCKMDEIANIAREYGLFVIEDAAESLGAKIGNQFVGTFGDLGCFSFNGNKTMTTGGGGMVVGRDSSRIEHIKFLVNQARDEKKGYFHPEVGFNYRMTNIEAAFGLAQMKRFKGLLKKKKQLNLMYRDMLSDIEGIEFQKTGDMAESSYWFTCFFKKDINISCLQEELKKKCVPTRRLFMPITEFPPYKKSKHGKLDNSYNLYKNGLCLPSSTLNTLSNIKYASKALKKLLG